MEDAIASPEGTRDTLGSSAWRLVGGEGPDPCAPSCSGGVTPSTKDGADDAYEVRTTGTLDFFVEDNSCFPLGTGLWGYGIETVMRNGIAVPRA